MKKIIARAIGAVLVGLTLVGCGASQKTWITNLDEAKALSAKNKQDMLLLFTGSDWDEQSQHLFSEVFTKSFFKKAGKKYVLCNLDFLQDEENADIDLLTINYAVALRMGVQSMPSAMLFTPDGDMYASAATPIEELNTAEFIKWLDSFSDSKTKLLTLKKKIDKSTGTDRAKKIDAFISEVNPAQRQQYTPLIFEVLELDANGEAGLRSKYRLLVADLEAKELSQVGDYDGAIASFASAAEEGLLDPAEVQSSWFMRAYLSDLANIATRPQIIQMLEKAVEADPNNSETKNILEIIEQIKNAPAEVSDK